MKPIADLPYPSEENHRLEKLKDLFEEWHARFKQAEAHLKPHDKSADMMVCDGFYPNYYSRKLKILFVGRESRDISGCNNMEVLWKAYRQTKTIGHRHINTDKFHKLILRLAYGLLNGMPEWDSLPTPGVIGDMVGTPEGISFAFMNLSKFSNDASGWSSNWPQINTSLRLSDEDRFNEKEVALLEPTVTIAMNFNNKLNALGKVTPLGSIPSAELYKLESLGHQSLLINAWHFSAPGKAYVEDYYQPICNAIRQHLTA